MLPLPTPDGFDEVGRLTKPPAAADGDPAGPVMDGIVAGNSPALNVVGAIALAQIEHRPNRS